MNRNFVILVSVVFVGILVGLLFFFDSSFVISQEIEEEDENYITQIIPEGSTFASLAEDVGLAHYQINGVIEAAKEVYDLSTVVSGRELAFAYAADGALTGLRYKINSEKQLIIEKIENVLLDIGELPAVEEGFSHSWSAKVENIPYEIQYETIEGTIESSLYETMVSSGIDERVAIALSEVFAWQFDFAIDIQKGDSFKLYYEKRYLNGEYIMPGRILTAEFINVDTTYRAYYFTGPKTKAGYYDLGGNALQKVFLKAPLQYKYISSGYSYARKTPILNRVMPHRAIDYAAPYGTPAVSIGDGKVVSAGWRQYYGLAVTVRHNETYKSVYGHLQSLARGIRSGVKVSQGQILGYVGSTGLSTGPHLHFEIHKHGGHVNPLTVETPPGEPINEEDRELFSSTIYHLQNLAGF